MQQPPGAGADGWVASLRSTWVSADFAFLLLVCTPVAWGLAAWLRRRGAADLVVRGRLALTALIATPFLEPLFFRCPVWAVAAAGAAIAWMPGYPLASRGAPRGSAWKVPALIGCVTLALVPGWPGVQGDEPHYLLVAHSIVQDGDVDVADEYDMQEFRPVHPTPLSPHSRPGLIEGSRYSMHGVGYGAMLAPAYAVGRRVSPAASVAWPRAMQALVFAAFAAALLRLCAPLAGEGAAAVAVLLACALAPLLFAPLHLFPETVAMALTCGAFAQMWGGRAGRADLLAGALLAALPWLGVKYIPLAAAVVVGGAIATDRWRAPRVSPQTLAAWAGPLLISLAAHGWFTHAVYGSWSPAAVYLGADPSFTRQPGFGGDWLAYLADWPGALRTLVGYFLDQREGLLAVGPQFLLAAAGLPLLWRRHRRLALALGIILLAHLGPYALSQQLGGHSPPARPLMAVAWTLVPAMALSLAVSGRWILPRAQSAVAVAGLALTTAFVLDPTLLPHDYGITRSWLLQRLAPEGVDLWRAFPSWVNLKEGPHWPVTLLWLAATVALALWLARDARGSVDPAAAATGRRRGAVAMFGVAALVCGWAATLVVTARHRGAVVGAGVTAYVISAVPEVAWAEPGGVWVAPGGVREIILVNDAPFGNSRVLARTLVDANTSLGYRGGALTLDLVGGQPASFAADLGPGSSWRGRRAVMLAVQAERGASPADIEGGQDHRLLGVFVRVEAGRGGDSE